MLLELDTHLMSSDDCNSGDLRLFSLLFLLLLLLLLLCFVLLRVGLCSTIYEAVSLELNVDRHY